MDFFNFSKAPEPEPENEERKDIEMGSSLIQFLDDEER